VRWSATFFYFQALALLGLALVASGARSPKPFREQVAAVLQSLLPLPRDWRSMALVTLHTAIAVSSVAYCTHAAVVALTR